MNGRSIRVSMTVVVAGILLAACGEFGSGDIETQERDVEAFDSIEISGALDVEIEVEPGLEPAVTVMYDDNIIDQVITEVRGDTLHVEVEGSFNAIGSGRGVEISIDDLDSLVISGASDVEVSSDALERLEVSGASEVVARGEVQSYELTVSGASDVHLRSFVAEHVSVDVSGASSVSVHATESIIGFTSGASDLDIYGSPNSVGVDSSGASDVDIRG